MGKKATNQLSRLVEKSVHETESNSRSEGEDKDHDVEDELFQALYETSPLPRRNKKDTFPGGETFKKTFDKDTFPNKAMRELFIKYNTHIPSSAAMECMLSMGKDVLRPKRSRMSDKHFEMLRFEEYGNLTDLPKLTRSADEARFVADIRDLPFTSAVATMEWLHLEISARTVRRRLRGIGIHHR
ncbi:hypothetical protein Hamer_G023875, partial [Homarus americanus]